MSRLITADASKVSPHEFFDALFPQRSPEEQAERVRLAREHQEAVKATWKLPFEQGMEERSRLSAAFNALVDAGKTEYMVVPVSDVLGEQVERELRFLMEQQGDAFQARAVAAAQSRRVSPSRPSGLPSLSQRKSA